MKSGALFKRVYSKKIEKINLKIVLSSKARKATKSYASNINFCIFFIPGL